MHSCETLVGIIQHGVMSHKPTILMFLLKQKWYLYCKFEHSRLDEIFLIMWVSHWIICSYATDEYDLEGVAKQFVVGRFKIITPVSVWSDWGNHISHSTLKSRSVPEGVVTVANLTLYCLVFCGRDWCGSQTDSLLLLQKLMEHLQADVFDLYKICEHKLTNYMIIYVYIIW